MRIILYLVILALLFLVPVERLDVAKLEPVQTVAISKENGMILLQTDTKDTGRGQTAKDALRDLEERTSGVIYLDTAEYLLVTEEALDSVDALDAYLSRKVRVSLWDGKGSVEEAARYLRVHGTHPKIDQWKTLVEK